MDELGIFDFEVCDESSKEKKIVEVCKCPECNTGMVIEKKTKKGKIFYGCNNYPKCKYATWDKPNNV